MVAMSPSAPTTGRVVELSRELGRLAAILSEGRLKTESCSNRDYCQWGLSCCRAARFPVFFDADTPSFIVAVEDKCRAVASGGLPGASD